MASGRSSVQAFWRQLWALTCKCFLVGALKRPIAFLLLCYAVPLAVLAVLLSIPSFLSGQSQYDDFGSLAQIRDLAGTLSKKLVIVKAPHLGPDVEQAVRTLTSPLDKTLVQFIEDESDLPSTCLSDTQGTSDCHAAIVFMDSPETTGTIADSQSGSEHAWQYVIYVDPEKLADDFSTSAQDSLQQNFFLPLQLAINNAITNYSSETPLGMPFNQETRAIYDELQREDNNVLVTQIYAFALFCSYFFIIYHVTFLITSERESGLSQLIDSMGGSSAVPTRVLSWLLFADIACLPSFVVSGVLYWHIMFPSSSVGLLIGWQVLLGLATNSSTVFASSFFAKSRASAIYVIGAYLLLAAGTQFFSFQTLPLPQPGPAYALTILFSSANFVLFLQQMTLWEESGKSAIVTELPIPDLGINTISYHVTQAQMLGFLAAQVIIYPLLAMAIEKLLHGIHFRSREFQVSSSASGVVAETCNLTKTFQPSLFARLCCCGKSRPNTAVDGVSLKGYSGQILGLVGPNGSGKTTTLHMMSGLVKPTSGTLHLDAMVSQVGLCPQRNTLWDDLTVYEHLRLWSEIKSSQEPSAELDIIIEGCGLQHKHDRRARTLSGGQKRKLQLACMFIGGSTVCLIDECTSGLDPLSRRVIWDILLQHRAQRSILFTTHFLDEIDVLADHVVILSKGRMKCQGSTAELKNLHGGGYKVLAPRSATSVVAGLYPSIEHQDRLFFLTPDSRSASELCATLSSAGISDLALAGPQFEDVFLRVADDAELQMEKLDAPLTERQFDIPLGRVTSFWSQVKTLFLKRFIILKRFWWPYFYVLAIPLIITPFFNRLLISYEQPTCVALQPALGSPTWDSLFYEKSCQGEYGYCEQVAVGPASANNTMYALLLDGIQQLNQVDSQLFQDFVKEQHTRQDFLDYIPRKKTSLQGGLFAGSDGEAPLVAYSLPGYSTALEFLNLWSQIESGIEIIYSVTTFAQTPRYPDNNGVIYVIFFTLVQAIYPAAFVLYPAIEKFRRVRGLQYVNGVRRAPLWIAYASFDAVFVMIISIASTIIVQHQVPWNGPVWIMLPILTFYGFDAILLGYVVSHFVSGPLKSFLAMGGISVLMYAVAAIAFAVGAGYSESMSLIDKGLTFGLNLVLPIGNVFRAVLLGLNVRAVGCQNGQHIPPASIFAYGGPILYLILQFLVLLFVIIWIEGDLAFFRRTRKASELDTEQRALRVNHDAEQEKTRVEQTSTDLLRTLHVDKWFGSNHAVDDVTLGLPSGDVLALIGPNGAGKSTLVNMIQAELPIDHGQILLCGEDARTRPAQKLLGVCPQFDALDLMNTEEHLAFYARIKGLTSVKNNVRHVMALLGLTPHANTAASKLSGGNKRKLSLAIALMGGPPVLVLDEPTSAMDAVAKRSFWRIIKEIAPGRSVLLTTHSMEEADLLATRTAIISKRILAVGTTHDLRQKYNDVYYVSLQLSSAPTSSPEDMEGLQAWVRENIRDSQLERAALGGQMRFTIPGKDGTGGTRVAGLIQLLEREKENIGIRYYSVNGATLENVFLSVVKESHIQEEDGTSRRTIWSRLFHWPR